MFRPSGTPSDALHVQAGVGVAAAEAFTALAEADGLGSVEVIEMKADGVVNFGTDLDNPNASSRSSDGTDLGGRRWNTSSR